MKRTQRFWRGLFFLILAIALCSGLALPVRAAPPRQTATSVVISEIRTRGSAGATDEFIEIFNPTGGDAPIGGWIIRRSSGCGPTTASIANIPAGVTLTPGEHYLIGGASYNDAVAPDLPNQTLNIADNGGIALFQSDGITLVDQAGLCATTSYVDSTALTPLTTNVDRGYERKLGGTSGSCEDTNNNAADFSLINPSNPESLSSAVTICPGVVTFTPSFTPSNTLSPTNTLPPSLTPSATPITPTKTFTPSITPTRTITPTPFGYLSVIINEIAWAGTAASTADEWIELHNARPIPVDLTGWVLKGADGTPNIPLSGILPANGYFLLERTDDNTVSDVSANLIFNGDIGNINEILQLFDPSNRLIDTANSNGGAWPAGSSTTYGSMERRGIIPDSDTAWITNVQSSTWTTHDARCIPPTPTPPPASCPTTYLIHGTPGYANWAYTVVPTPSRTPTRTRTPRPTPTKTRPPTLAPQPLIGINEFLPRPGHDWNNDGAVNTEDEYIELINFGVIDVNLGGYTLDDEANIGSTPFRLPAIILKPGQRIVFYGSDTQIHLDDGGDGVRLLKPNGQLADAYNYSVVRFPDEAYCRVPDNGGLDDWNEFCYPTPGLPNTLSAGFVNPSTNASESTVCPISDSLPLDFVLAECPPFGNNIWRRAYWDDSGWLDDKILPESTGKWSVFGN